jgi:hypothetical protein
MRWTRGKYYTDLNNMQELRKRARNRKTKDDGSTPENQKPPELEDRKPTPRRRGLPAVLARISTWKRWPMAKELDRLRDSGEKDMVQSGRSIW